jgi:tripartite-type tricarboxylate transporter receptor subunit TctC
MMKKLVLRCMGICALLGLASAAAAQNFPAKPIRMVVGFAPGGAVDIVARTIAAPMGDVLGQPVVIDTRPGANGMLGADLVAKAPPDGYTIGLVSISSLVLNVHLHAKPPYHAVRDFTPISTVGLLPFVIAVHPAVPARSLKELVSLARGQPGKLTVGTPGVGGLQHLTIEMLNSAAKVSLHHIPYKGTTPAMTDVMGGHIDAVIGGVPGILEPHKAGRLRAVAVTDENRVGVMPDVPTAREQGLPDLVVVNWYAIVGPANLPAQTLTALHASIVKGAALAATREKFTAAGVDVKTDPTPAAFAEYVRGEFTRWGVVVKNAGVRIE